MSRTGRFVTAIRDDARRFVEQLGGADIVVGIPCFCSEESLEYVIRVIATGLDQYCADRRALIIVADGGSTDDTREVARSVNLQSFNIELLVTIYRGIPGKGSAVRAIFEVAHYLRSSALAIYDSDLRSIKPDWVRRLLLPVEDGYDFVAPSYNRFKYDGTITNTIAYNLVRSLYGVNIRQPIGGDFAFSRAFVSHCLNQDVWDTDIAKFGIDIWLTITAVTGDFQLCQSRLGAKIHGQKDPAADLGPMFRQVVGTIYSLVNHDLAFLQVVDATVSPPTFGEFIPEEPESFRVDPGPLIDYFRIGYRNFGSIWEGILEADDFKVVKSLVHCRSTKRLQLPTDVWVRVVYRYADYFGRIERQRIKVLDTLIPLYHAKVATLVLSLEGKTQTEAESFYEQQAMEFERMRAYFLDLVRERRSLASPAEPQP
jgi:glycosyltransferase involved in cell wall biosynthesis